MTSPDLRRVGLVLAGLLLGAASAVLGIWVWLQAAQVEEARTAVAERLRLPEEAFELEEVTPDGSLRITFRDVLIHGEAGDTILATPALTTTLDLSSLEEPGAPLVFRASVLERPYARLVQARDGGGWNALGAFGVTAAGEEVAGEAEGRDLLFRGVEIRDGRVTLVLPTEPLDTAGFAARLGLPRTTLGGEPYQVYRLSGVDAELGEVLVAGEEGWRVEVDDASAQLAEPALRIAGLRGAFSSDGGDDVRVTVDALAVGDSRLSAEGRILLGGEGVGYDLRLEAAPLALADVHALLPELPPEGEARFALRITPEEGGRTGLAFEELLLDTPDARLSGGLAVVAGGGAPLAFGPTALRVETLDLALLERLGVVDSLPVAGEVTGTLAAADPEAGLRLDLTAALVPVDAPGAEPSLVTALGGVELGGDAGVRLREMRLQLRPLHLATLVPFLPEQRERLRGAVRGEVTLNGAPGDLAVAGGELLYEVGGAGPTRLAGLEGTVRTEPALRYDLRADADPLALATLTELFPALPFRTATLSGPIRVAGDAETVEVQADLGGQAGGFSLRGAVALGEVPRFDLSGRVQSLAPGALLSGQLPVEGSLTGTYALRGIAEDLAFEVDLAQTAGRFALDGRLRLADGVPPALTVSGEVGDFRIGALIGRAGLFPAPMSGLVRVDGGGAEPYRFDLDLSAEDALLDVDGFFDPEPLATYVVRGRVRGLNAARLPVAFALPTTHLNATFDVQGEGTTLETLAGTLRLDARGSTVSGIPVQTGLADVAVRDGVMMVDTAFVQIRDTRLSAQGLLGLTAPVASRLTFAFVSPDLSALSRTLSTATLIEPQLEGALRVEGTVAGTVENPSITAGVRGQRLRFEGWRAADLGLTAELARDPITGWGGQLALVGDRLALNGIDDLQAVRLEASGTQASFAVGLYARRDDQTDVALSGLLELDGAVPRGLAMESLTLRLGDVAWRLLQPTRVRWGGAEGVLVENLLLERAGAAPGLIQVHGTIPPSGVADLRLRAQGVDLADLRRVAPATPDLGGVLTMEAALSGPVATPELTLDARVDRFRYQGAGADLLTLGTRYAGGEMAVNAAVWLAGAEAAVAEATVPMTLSIEGLAPSFELRRAAPLAGRIVADAFPLALVAELAPPLARGTGTASARIDVAGTIDRPDLSGFARVQGGAFTVEPLNARYEQIEANLLLQDDVVRVETFRAVSGGTLAVEGTVEFVPDAAPQLDLTAVLADFRAIDVEETARVRISGNLALTGELTAPVLRGNAAIAESEIWVPELGGQAGIAITDIEVGQLGADTATVVPDVPAFLANLGIDAFEVRADESVWLVSDELRLQIRGDLLVYRQGEELRVFGALETVRGTYALELGSIIREFEIVSGRVQFFGTDDLNPSVEIVAANRIRGTEDLTVLVNVTGTMQAPRISLSSDTPTPLSESDLFSYLIFGRPSFQLQGLGSEFAEQIFVQEVLGGILASELERPILEAGICDYVRVNPGISVASFTNLLSANLGSTLTSAAIECGREIYGDLFATAETGIGALFGSEVVNWRVGLEWQIDAEWMWELSWGPVRPNRIFQAISPIVDYQLSTDVRRRWEYGRPRRVGPLEPLPVAALDGRPFNHPLAPRRPE